MTEGSLQGHAWCFKNALMFIEHFIVARYSFICFIGGPFNKYSLSTYCVPGAVLGTGGTVEGLLTPLIPRPMRYTLMQSLFSREGN